MPPTLLITAILFVVLFVCRVVLCAIKCYIDSVAICFNESLSQIIAKPVIIYRCRIWNAMGKTGSFPRGCCLFSNENWSITELNSLPSFSTSEEIGLSGCML
jgi:hypothetical protein